MCPADLAKNEIGAAELAERVLFPEHAIARAEEPPCLLEPGDRRPGIAELDVQHGEVGEGVPLLDRIAQGATPIARGGETAPRFGELAELEVYQPAVP